jgi:hypothetical protein
LRDLESLSREDSTTFDRRRELGLTHAMLARVLLDRSDAGGAVTAAQAALRLLGANAAEGRAMEVARLNVQVILGRALAGAGRAPEARTTLSRAVALARSLGAGSGGAEVRPSLAEAYLALDSLADARIALTRLGHEGYREPWLSRLAQEKGLRLDG